MITLWWRATCTCAPERALPRVRSQFRVSPQCFEVKDIINPRVEDEELFTCHLCRRPRHSQPAAAAKSQWIPLGGFAQALWGSKEEEIERERERESEKRRARVRAGVSFLLREHRKGKNNHHPYPSSSFPARNNWLFLYDSDCVWDSNWNLISFRLRQKGKKSQTTEEKFSNHRQ